MENLTIYNVYVEMTSQEQCDRMKQLCIDNVLPIWNRVIGFSFNSFGNFFCYNSECNQFFIHASYSKYRNTKTKVTEEQFIELLKNK